MSYNKRNPNGQATSANSAPSVLSSEQEAKIDLLATKAKQDLLLAELQLKADITETQPISVASLPLPSGAAVAANQQTNAITDAQIRATPLPISGTISTGLSQPLTDTQLRASTVPVSVSGVATEATLALIKAKTDNIDVLLSTRTKPLDTQKVDGSAVTQPVSGTVTVNAGTNLNTSTLALETGGNLASIKTNTDKIPSQGQALAAASLPVVLTAIQQVALTPPAAITGFSTEATLSAVSGKLPSTLGGKTIANSLAINIANDQVVPISASSLPIPTGASTSALQTTGNTSLSTIAAANDVANSTRNAEATQLLVKAKTDNLDVLLSTRLKPADTLAGVTTVGSVTAITNALPTGSNTIGAVTNTNLDVALSTRLKPSDTLTKVATVDTITNPLPSGTNLLGRVGIDQTTNGTTNRVNIGIDGQVATNGVIFAFSPTTGGNSTTTQLASGATFTGTIESIVNQQAYSLLFFSDQNATITLNQFIDAGGTKNIQQQVFTYIAGARFARSGAANGNYAQVVIQNTGGSTTTTLQADMAYGTIAPATQLNNNPVGINEINGTVVSSGTGASDAGTQRFTQSIESASGNITTQNLVANGTATANSAVEITLNGAGALSVQTTGTYTGALSVQLTNDNTRWETVTATSIINTITGAYTATIASAAIGLFQFECGGFLKARVTGLAAMTGTAVVTIRASRDSSLVTIDNALPAGTNSIGNIATVTTVSTLSNTTQLTPGVAAGNLGKAEDAVAASGDTGVAILGIRNDTLTSNVSANGDYAVPVQDLYGATIIKDQQRHKRTYRIAFVVAPATTPTDIFQLIGSATTTVEVTNLWISGTQTTGGMVDLFIKKRSTANTGGTSSASTNVPMNAADAAATAVGAIYTANPTLGTDVGNIWIQTIPLSAITAITNNIVNIEFGRTAKPLILSGVTQAMAINLNGAAVTGSSVKVVVEFLEY